jgi:tetratricopeptide (TPR) repeat protein
MSRVNPPPSPAAQRSRLSPALLVFALALLALARGRDLASRALANGGAIHLARAALAGRAGSDSADELFGRAAGLGAPQAAVGLGRSAYLRGDWAEAVRQLEAYQQQHPADEVAGYFLAGALLAPGPPFDAGQLQAIAPQALAAAVLAEIRAGRWEAAAAAWHAAPLAPGAVQQDYLARINHELTRHALEARNCGQVRARLDELQEWLAVIPGLRPEEYVNSVHYDLAQCYQALGDSARAAAYFEATVARDPRFSPWAYAFLADIAAARGDTQTTRGWLEAGLAAFPGDEVLAERSAALRGEARDEGTGP